MDVLARVREPTRGGTHTDPTDLHSPPGHCQETSLYDVCSTRPTPRLPGKGGRDGGKDLGGSTGPRLDGNGPRRDRGEAEGRLKRREGGGGVSEGESVPATERRPVRRRVQRPAPSAVSGVPGSCVGTPTLWFQRHHGPRS